MKIPFPLKGIDENWSYENQPPVTCRAATNVVAYDPATGRASGAQRVGHTGYVILSGTTVEVNSSNPIQEMNHVVTSKNDYAYADVDPPTEVWEKAMEHASLADPRSSAISSDGFVYVLGEENWITRVNSSGAQELHVNIGPHLADPTFQAAMRIAVATDPITSERYLYIVTNGLSALGYPSLLLKYQEVGSNGLELVWASPLEIPNADNVFDIVVDANTNTSGARIYLLHQLGLLTQVTDSGTSALVNGTAPTQAYAKRLNLVASGIMLISCYPGEKLVKLNQVSATEWTQAWELTGIGGTGSVSKTDGSGYTFWCTGTAATGKVAWKYTDVLDKTSVAAPTNTWSYGAASSVGFAPAIDTSENFYYINMDSAAALKVFRLIGETDPPTKDWEYDSGFTGQLRSFHLDPKYPDGETVPEFMYTVADDASDPDNIAIDKARLRLRSISGTTTRTIRTIAIANGRAAYKASASVWTLIGSAGDFTTSLRYVSSAVFNQKVYIVDGVNQRLYDPSDDSMTGWTTTKGYLPQGVRQISVWNGRLVVYGDPGDPFNWFMSAYGDGTDFDYFPIVTLATQAVAGNVSKSGKCPDLVNAFIPFSDDLAIFGGDHEIWRLTGDPMEGGRFDQITDVTGMAYGTAWCKDDKGIIYFYGSKGGVYAMTPGGIPQSLTEGRRENTLASIDVATNKIMLVWDHRARGVHVYVTPFSAAATTHYFWDRRLDAWFDRSFSTPSAGSAGDLDPTAVHVVDGDAPGDRAILIGSRDGKVRYVDYATPAVTDDGTLIDSSVTIGPIQPSLGAGIEAKLVNTKAVLNNSSGNVNFELYSSDEALQLGTMQHNGLWLAGRNYGEREVMRGNAFWLKLTDRFGAAWALESLEMDFEPAGRVRNT